MLRNTGRWNVLVFTTLENLGAVQWQQRLFAFSHNFNTRKSHRTSNVQREIQTQSAVALARCPVALFLINERQEQHLQPCYWTALFDWSVDGLEVPVAVSPPYCASIQYAAQNGIVDGFSHAKPRSVVSEYVQRTTQPRG